MIEIKIAIITYITIQIGLLFIKNRKTKPGTIVGVLHACVGVCEVNLTDPGLKFA